MQLKKHNNINILYEWYKRKKEVELLKLSEKVNKEKNKKRLELKTENE